LRELVLDPQKHYLGCRYGGGALVEIVTKSRLCKAIMARNLLVYAHAKELGHGITLIFKFDLKVDV
jgi:hypothetical protein